MLNKKQKSKLDEIIKSSPSKSKIKYDYELLKLRMNKTTDPKLTELFNDISIILDTPYKTNSDEQKKISLIQNLCISYKNNNVNYPDVIDRIITHTERTDLTPTNVLRNVGNLIRIGKEQNPSNPQMDKKKPSDYDNDPTTFNKKK